MALTGSPKGSPTRSYCEHSSGLFLAEKEYAQAVTRDYAKHAKDAHDYNLQASRSSARHSTDLKEMKRVNKEAANNLKQGQKKQWMRKCASTITAKAKP